MIIPFELWRSLLATREAIVRQQKGINVVNRACGALSGFWKLWGLFEALKILLELLCNMLRTFFLLPMVIFLVLFRSILFIKVLTVSKKWQISLIFPAVTLFTTPEKQILHLILAQGVSITCQYVQFDAKRWSWYSLVDLTQFVIMMPKKIII